MAYIDLKDESTLELARAKAARCGGISEAARQAGLSWLTMKRCLDGDGYSMWGSTAAKFEAWLEIPRISDSELQQAARDLIAEAGSAYAAAKAAGVSAAVMRHFALEGRAAQPKNRAMIEQWVFRKGCSTPDEPGRRTESGPAGASAATKKSDRPVRKRPPAQKPMAAETKPRIEEKGGAPRSDPRVAVPASELSGDDLRGAIAAEWEEWGRFCGIEDRVPGGIEAIEAYLAGKIVDPRCVRALRLHMGFMDEDEERDAWAAHRLARRRGARRALSLRWKRPGMR